MMCIDLEDGVVLIPFTNNVLEAAEMAKHEGGRLRLVVSGAMDTIDSTVGCQALGDWRAK